LKRQGAIEIARSSCMLLVRGVVPSIVPVGSGISGRVSLMDIPAVFPALSAGRFRIGGQERLVLSMGEMDPESGSEKGKGDDISPEEAMIESLVEKLELSLDTAIKKVKFSQC